MKGSSFLDWPVARIDTAWQSADHENLEGLDRHRMCGSNVEQLRNLYRSGLTLIPVALYDYCARGGWKICPVASGQILWMPMFLFKFGAGDEPDIMAALWVHPDIASFPNAAEVLAEFVPLEKEHAGDPISAREILTMSDEKRQMASKGEGGGDHARD